MTSEKVKILFLGSNPGETERLRLDEEAKAIDRMIRASEHRNVLELSSHWAAEPDDLLQLLNEEMPSVVHFSGHGTPIGEIILVDVNGEPKSVNAQALSALFTTLQGNIRLVLLNACYSKTQADAISKVIDCVIGMSNEISDKASIAFAASFYRAIGFGLSIKEAYEQGKVSLLLEGIAGETIPDLIERDGIDAKSVVLVNTTSDRSSLSGGGIRPLLDPAKVIEVQTEFFNRLTEALWKWRYMAMQVVYYGGQDNREKFTSVSQAYDEGSWGLFSEIRIEISKAQRYLSYATYLRLRNLYAFIVEVDKKLSSLIVFPESGSDQNLPQNLSRESSLLNDYIFSEVTDRIESVIAFVAAELRLGFDE